MSKTTKLDDHRLAPAAPPADGEVLHFLSRTLQSHVLDGKPQSAQEKLQTLLSALEQQERTLSDWPESAGKARMCDALAKARGTVAKILADLGRHPPDTRAHLRPAKAM